jgi:hypothetical protein
MADAAFERWRDVFTASGNLDEAVVVDDFGHLSILREPFGFASDASARYRSWEAGIMGFAFLYHLTGYAPDVPDGKIHLAPQLPPEWNDMSFNGLSYAEGRFDLEVKRTQINSRLLTITTDKKTSFVLDLTVPCDADISCVRVNGIPAAFTFAANSYGRKILSVQGILIPKGSKTQITTY